MDIAEGEREGGDPRKEMQAIGTTTLNTMKFGRRQTHSCRWTAQKRRLAVARDREREVPHVFVRKAHRVHSDVSGRRHCEGHGYRARGGAVRADRDGEVLRVEGCVDRGQ